MGLRQAACRQSVHKVRDYGAQPTHAKTVIMPTSGCEPVTRWVSTSTGAMCVRIIYRSTKGLVLAQASISELLSP